MANNFQEYRIEECMEAIIDYRGKTPSKTSAGIPLITAKVIKNGRIQKVDEFIAENDYESWMRRGIPEKGDVVLTTEAPLGEVAQLDDRKVALAQRVITLRGKKGLLNNDYLKFLLLSNEVQHQLDGRGTGTTVKGIKQSELRKVKLRLPDWKTQKNIAHVLKTLDNKIELNQQTNQTLEQMAQALFRSWFVDFEPVIDNALAAGNDIPEPLQHKAELRKQAQQLPDFRALPDDILALFPSGFEECDFGCLPIGWKVGSFENLMLLQRGFDLPKTKRTAGVYPLIAASGQDGTHCGFKVVGPGVTTGRSGKLGEVTFIQNDFWPLNTTLWVKEYKLSNPYHAYFFLKTLPLEEFNAGSAVPTLNRNHVHGYRCILPDKNITDAFELMVSKWFEKIDHNQKAIQKTDKLRNFILPKLISGKITLNQDIA